MGILFSKAEQVDLKCLRLIPVLDSEDASLVMFSDDSTGLPIGADERTMGLVPMTVPASRCKTTTRSAGYTQGCIYLRWPRTFSS